MGSRPYAKLFFGIALPSENAKVPWADEDDEDDECNTNWDEGIQDWLLENGFDPNVFRVGTSGYHDEARYFLAIRESYTSMDWDDGYKPIDIDRMANQAVGAWIALIERFKVAAGLNEPPNCWLCDGSGKRSHDGTPCSPCKGTGKESSWKYLEPRWMLTTFY